MEMCYDGMLVMPSSCWKMTTEEMEYVEGGGTITVVFTRDFIRDSVTAITSAVCTIIGTALGTAVGNSVVGGAIGAAVGWIIGGSVARAYIKKGYSFSFNLVGFKDRTVKIS